MSDSYIIGVLNRTGRTYRHSWADHILEAEYSYGPLGQRTWGQTLCGLRGSMATPVKMYAFEEVASRVPKVTLCGNCRRVAKSRWASAFDGGSDNIFDEVHP